MMFSHQTLTILVLSGFALYAAADCTPFTIKVSQGRSVLVDAAIPITEARDVEAFYNLVGSSTEASYEGTVVLAESEKSLIMVHHDSDSCEKSLVIVHDKRFDLTGGIVRFRITGNLTDPTVDDGLNVLSYNSGTDKTSMRWNWDACCTDGVALPLDLENRIPACITVEPSMFDRIDDWEYVSEPSAGSLVYTPLSMTEDLVLCYAEIEDPPITEPENCKADFCSRWYNFFCWLMWWFRCSVFGGGDE
jgi:hypothetical protein